MQHKVGVKFDNPPPLSLDEEMALILDVDKKKPAAPKVEKDYAEEIAEIEQLLNEHKALDKDILQYNPQEESEHSADRLNENEEEKQAKKEVLPPPAVLSMAEV